MKKIASVFGVAYVLGAVSALGIGGWQSPTVEPDFGLVTSYEDVSDVPTPVPVNSPASPPVARSESSAPLALESTSPACATEDSRAEQLVLVQASAEAQGDPLPMLTVNFTEPDGLQPGLAVVPATGSPTIVGLCEPQPHPGDAAPCTSSIFSAFDGFSVKRVDGVTFAADSVAIAPAPVMFDCAINAAETGNFCLTLAPGQLQGHCATPVQCMTAHCEAKTIAVAAMVQPACHTASPAEGPEMTQVLRERLAALTRTKSELIDKETLIAEVNKLELEIRILRATRKMEEIEKDLKDIVTDCQGTPAAGRAAQMLGTAQPVNAVPLSSLPAY